MRPSSVYINALTGRITATTDWNDGRKHNDTSKREEVERGTKNKDTNLNLNLNNFNNTNTNSNANLVKK